jgi:hypothetical protein
VETDDIVQPVLPPWHETQPTRRQQHRDELAWLTGQPTDAELAEEQT